MIAHKTNNIWVEITSYSHEHGGRGWKHSKYLW